MPWPHDVRRKSLQNPLDGKRGGPRRQSGQSGCRDKLPATARNATLISQHGDIRSTDRITAVHIFYGRGSLRTITIEIVVVVIVVVMSFAPRRGIGLVIGSFSCSELLLPTSSSLDVLLPFSLCS
jgi:hypothetical protein